MDVGLMQRVEFDHDEADTLESSADRQRSIIFDRFVARPAARTLLRDGVPLEIGARAFDMLMVLLTSRGEVVSKDEIMAYVWPTTTVDESNLRFQMAVLRKTLGRERDLIKTIPGRGYLLIDDLDDAPFDAIAQLEAYARPRTLTDNEKSLFDAVRALLVVAGRCPSALVSLEAAFSKMGSAAAA